MDQSAKSPPRKENNDNKHRLFEILSQIKESISKRRYNHAFEMGSKYYEQNKTLLTNQEIYQLCWKCCITIENKIRHRLTSKKKKYIPPITQTHIQHLFSLQMSLHSIVLPQIVKLNHNHFNMLSVKSEAINPKQISTQYMSFQRKSKDYFLKRVNVQKEMKKLIKQHLKICNNVLMYKINQRKGFEQIEEHFAVVQQIYQQFQEYDFPSEHMDFTLIKLSFMEFEGAAHKISCQYRLPLGFLAKLYQKIRKNKEDAIEHCLNKLTSFFVLSLRHVSMTIQDVYILTSQIQYITRILIEEFQNAYSKRYNQQKKLGLTVKRLVTIDKEPFQENLQRPSKRQDSMSTYNKLSQKMESKQTIRRTFNFLKFLAQQALNQISSFQASRREVIQIALRYFTLNYLQKSRNKEDEIIEQEVLLNNKLKKRNNLKQLSQENETFNQKPARRNRRTLTSILKDIRLEKKTSSIQDGSEVEKVRFHTTAKQQGKFIIKNMEKIQKKSELKIGYFKDINTILKLVENEEKNAIVQQPSSNQNNQLQDFELERLKKIKSFKEKLRAKSSKEEKTSGNTKQPKDPSYQNQISKEKEQKKINLLNDVVQRNIKMLLQLPLNQPNDKNNKNVDSLANKLQVLKVQSQNLNTQRKMMVQRLMKRRQQCFEFYSSNYSGSLSLSNDKEMQYEKENQQQIAKYSLNFKNKIDKYVQSNKNLIKINQKKKPSHIKFQEKPSSKLKLDKKTKTNKKSPEITFQNLQQQYNKLEGRSQCEKKQWQMALSSQFDKLRRDAAKNQFISQNDRKTKADKIKHMNNTIYEITLDDEQENFQ